MTRTSMSPRAEINPTSALQAQLKIRPRRSRKFSQEACSAAGCSILRKETRDWEAGRARQKEESYLETEELGSGRGGKGRARQDQEERAEGRGEKRGAGREETAQDHCYPHPH